MKHNQIQKLVSAALFAALILVGTYFLRIPMPFGYFNFGDCFVLLSAVIVGGPGAVMAAAVGSVLGDVLSGYVMYAPATLIIKALMALVMMAFARLGSGRSRRARGAATLAGAIVAEGVMVCGYFLCDRILFGFAGAVAALPGSLLQGAAAVAAGSVLLALLERSGLWNRRDHLH